MNIAVFGGSFDPIHIAHEAIVENALNSLDIDKIIVVPTYLNPFKNSFHLEPKTRFNLLKKVFYNKPKVEVSDFEINQNRAVYSLETVKHLKNLYKPNKIYIIIGQDNLASLDKWHGIKELKKLASFVIFTRKDCENENLDKFKVLDLNIDISSTKLREELNLSYIPNSIKEDLLNLQTNKKG